MNLLYPVISAFKKINLKELFIFKQKDIFAD